MSSVDDLVAIKTAVMARLTEMVAAPKPSYKTATGQSVDWNGYQKLLMQQLKDLNALIVAEDPTYSETQLVLPDDPLV